MANQWKRQILLQVEDLQLSGLDLEFRIEKSLKQTQNSAEVIVYNLSRAHQKHLQEAKQPIVKLSAGYVGTDPTKPATDAALAAIGIGKETSQDPPILFLGQLRDVVNERDGADYRTTITSGDGDKQKARPIDFSLGPGSSLTSAITRVIKELGAGIATGTKEILGAGFPGLGKIFTGGAVVSGNAMDELGKLLHGAGLEYSIQDGEIQILPAGSPLTTLAIVVNEAGGLVGSPELGYLGAVKFRCMLNGDIRPGRRVKLEAEFVNGFFRVDRVTHLGQIAGNDWFSDVEGTPVH